MPELSFLYQSMTTQTQAPTKTTSTHCPYCAFQCGMTISGEPSDAIVIGDEDFPVNKGALCLKGWTSAEALPIPNVSALLSYARRMDG